MYKIPQVSLHFHLLYSLINLKSVFPLAKIALEEFYRMFLCKHFNKEYTVVPAITVNDNGDNCGILRLKRKRKCGSLNTKL